MGERLRLLRALRAGESDVKTLNSITPKPYNSTTLYPYHPKTGHGPHSRADHDQLAEKQIRFQCRSLTSLNPVPPSLEVGNTDTLLLTVQTEAAVLYAPPLLILLVAVVAPVGLVWLPVG